MSTDDTVWVQNVLSEALRMSNVDDFNKKWTDCYVLGSPEAEQAFLRAWHQVIDDAARKLGGVVDPKYLRFIDQLGLALVYEDIGSDGDNDEEKG